MPRKTKRPRLKESWDVSRAALPRSLLKKKVSWSGKTWEWHFRGGGGRPESGVACSCEPLPLTRTVKKIKKMLTIIHLDPIAYSGRVCCGLNRRKDDGAFMETVRTSPNRHLSVLISQQAKYFNKCKSFAYRIGSLTNYSFYCVCIQRFAVDCIMRSHFAKLLNSLGPLPDYVRGG
jgi:hypothetical protein